MAAGAGAGSLWNKNSWHWEEKKYTTWAHGWLREKLTAINVEKSGASARVTKIAQLTGDVRGRTGVVLWPWLCPAMPLTVRVSAHHRTHQRARDCYGSGRCQRAEGQEAPYV